MLTRLAVLTAGVCLIAVLCLGAATTAQAAALADYPMVQADLIKTPTDSAIHAWLEKGGLPNGRPPVVPSSSAVATVDDLWLSEHRPIPGQPSSAELHRQLSSQTGKLRASARLLPKLGTALGAVGLGASVFTAGWEIGTVARSLFFDADVPAKPHTRFTKVSFEEAGWCGWDYYTPEYCASHPRTPALPVDGFVALRDGTSPYSGLRDSELSAWQLPGFTMLTGAYYSTAYGPTADRLWLQPVAAPAPRATPTPDVSYKPRYDWPTGTQGTNGEPASTTQARVRTEFENNPDAYGVVLPWLNYKLGAPGQSDPTGEGEPNPEPEIEFPEWFRHWEDHGGDFLRPDGTPLYDDPVEYWRDAADIVERGEADPSILSCEGTDDEGQPATYYWDTEKQAIVIVKNGKIVTYFIPEDGFDYWLRECG